MQLFKSIILLFFCFIILIGCKNPNGFSVKSFDPLANLNSKKNDSIYYIQTDLSNAVLYGIQIPTVNQLKNGKFSLSFTLENNTGEKKDFYYKIFYQNDSYKFNYDTSLCTENFYGSWLDTGIEFKKISMDEGTNVITDSFNIVGNPRNENVYFGANPETVRLSDTLVNRFINNVKGNQEWYKSAIEKAKGNKISVDEQVFLEAMWGVNDFFQNQKNYNNRWKRNPRMGNYKFMLVVCNESGLSRIPDAVKNISKLDSLNSFINPFTYFHSFNSDSIKDIKVIHAYKSLNVSTSLDLTKGIYVDRLSSNLTKQNTSMYSNDCGESDDLYKSAIFSQYFHHINKNYEFSNVKKMMDVVDENYTREQYQQMLSEYSKNKNLVNTHSNATDCPCKTVKTNSSDKSISIINPGNINSSVYKKEHVGIKSRVGFTYGKWRAKIKFPKNISNDNVWNGLTNAFWLLFQSEDGWNKRRGCFSDVGYIPKSAPDSEESIKQSSQFTNYSEIDFEILKESQYWTKSTYGENAKNVPTEDAASNRNITVCCTNWDMACHAPKDYFFGAKDYNVDGKTYSFGRWNYFNKLITSKVPVSHDEMFNDDYYYFEIDWQPTRIIWRIGKDKNNLKEICRMNDAMTSIPNNQMIMLLTQEFHYQEWWPTAPFLQNVIPFPKNNLEGKLFEVEIE
jgi:hypothetical protein